MFEDPEIGKRTVTHYEVIERFGFVSMVKCVLETGRTHRIRRRMLHKGTSPLQRRSLRGDAILKGNTSSSYRRFIENCFTACPRQALHARTLGFRHPRTGEEMDFEAPVPDGRIAAVRPLAPLHLHIRLTSAILLPSIGQQQQPPSSAAKTLSQLPVEGRGSTLFNRCCFCRHNIYC